MFPAYQVDIMGVDYGTNYSMQGTDKALLLAFLQRYDHEGSSIALTKRSAPEVWETIEDNEAVYRELLS
jgi:hypothetical protein